MTTNIEEFAESVKKIADEKRDIILSNSGREKAGIVLSNIFRTSNNNLKIFAESLSDDVCGQPHYLNELNNCILRIGVPNVHILLESKPNLTSKAFALIKSYNIPVYILKEPSLFFNTFKNKKINFTIGDESMFRLETDTINYNALFCFKEANVSRKLSSIFQDNYSNNSEILP